MTGLYWFSHALMTDPSQFGWMIPFALLLVPAVLGIYTGIVTTLVSFFNTRIQRMLAFISAWVLVEVLRTNFIIPFSWNLLGYTLVASNNLLQFSSIAGLYGCSLLVAFIGSFLYTKDKRVIITALIIGSFVWGYGSWRLFNKEDSSIKDFKIRLVQPSILEHPMGNRAKQDEAMERLAELSMSNLSKDIKYVIWPEASFPYGFHHDIITIKHLALLAPKEGAVIIGSDRIILENDKYKIFNSIISISSNAEVLGIYDKEILVPYGEYIPFKKFIPFVDKVTHGAEDFSQGINPSNVMRINTLPPFLPLICYETIFPNLNTTNAMWMLNITNDAWFGNSIGPHQHFAMSQFRAVEYGIPMVRVANNGITAVISPYGEIVSKLHSNEIGVLDINLPAQVTKNRIQTTIFYCLNYLAFLIFALAIYLRLVHSKTGKRNKFSR